ncbi:hypothetical protein SS50377_26366 [Spironucleus salmonicida]|uniref:Uncharacterized protein n=1 Tax=Spironucleus salmonicida TaxID=348837 RepID=V6LSZ4_9EUKA|nr:hypothetical protein SS50377_26366 [Spironucleus salmonicida]|eukprot:EST47767.1 Hypothetical protein SS50377_12166 [Spironucleus salmonicida]
MFSIIKNNCSSNSLLKNITAFQTSPGIKRNPSSNLKLLQTAPSPRRNRSILNLSLNENKPIISKEKSFDIQYNVSKHQFQPSFQAILEDDKQDDFEKLIAYNKKIFFTPEDERQSSALKFQTKSPTSWEPIDIRDIIIRMYLPTIEPLFKKAEDIEDLLKIGMKSKLKRMTVVTIKKSIMDIFAFQKQQIQSNTKADKLFKGGFKKQNSILLPTEVVSAKVETQLFMDKMRKLQMDMH